MKFPFHIRIPEWCKNPVIKINGVIQQIGEHKGMVVFDQTWNSKDQISLYLPMELRFSHWSENSLGIERGPLVYALKIEEEWQEKNREGIDDTFWEVTPISEWNFGFPANILKHSFTVVKNETISSMPWNLQNAPIMIKTSARKILSWSVYNGSAGKIPATPISGSHEMGQNDFKIELIPYGCTTLRISQFPVY